MSDATFSDWLAISDRDADAIDGAVDNAGWNTDSQVMPESDRLSRVEGVQDGIKQSQNVLVMSVGVVSAALFAAVAVLAAFQVFTFQSVQSLDTKITARADATDAKIDAIPQRLTEEFRAMRADTTAQTSALANSITAARQFQPQILVLPPGVQPAPR